jgi:hypothetical protein
VEDELKSRGEFLEVTEKNSTSLRYIDTTPSHIKSRRGKCAGQTFSTLTTFVENACNIYIFK